jgi:ATP-dependent helicase/nuclease subunit A
MPDTSMLLDAQDRLLAETTWNRNIIVVAGAGTGKTTILVNRILNLLMREPQPLSMTEIVALTFTNKAATEMKQRLRRELIKLVEHTDDALMALFRSRYQLSSQVVTDRASTALEHLEKSQIGTLHSFAAHLLRLHPLESGIDPSFHEDDGNRFTELLTSQWERWLADELGNRGQQHDRWRRVLGVADLEDLRRLAELMAGESIDLHELERQCGTSLNDTLRQWLTSIRARVSSLLATRATAKQLKAERMLSATERLLSILLEEGTDAMERLSADDRTWLKKDIGKPTAGWDHAAFDDAKAVLTVAQCLLAVDQRSMHEMITLLRPFVTSLHQAFSASGWISFDGLLARAKALLRDHHSVRARMKQTYRAILVDEFQDTDPVQYEIILYLAERHGSAKSSWVDLELESGKLFIVGDPKQSIYAFRRADIEAYERVLKKILDGGGLACSLRTNFRSDGSVLSVVNEVFDRLLEAKEHVQPSNEQLTARPQRKTELSASGVHIRLVTGAEDDDFDAAAATRVEAEELAHWMKKELLAATTVISRDGLRAPLQPGHIALIFRKLTQAQEYLDALRRYGIAYLTDGEKHFYRRQEIVDLVNVLRVIENPHDLIALVGLLRSSLGGISDQDLLTLQQMGGLDITNRTALSRWAHTQAAVIKSLYARLTELHRVASSLPVPEVLTKIFDRLPVLELAAASLHGEQAMANLLKVRDMAEEVADRPHLTLTGFVELMMQRLMDQPEEAESALSEASLDAVRVLTIHKAKGLEFPVVVLPGLHQGARNQGEGPAIHYDWSSRCYGVTIAGQCNIGSVLVGDKMAAREEAEHRRLLYVGMTRARDLLVLSGGRPQRARRDTVWSTLQEAMGEEILAGGNETLEVGTGQITRVVKPGSLTMKRHRAKTITSVPVPEFATFLERQRLRRERWLLVRTTPKRLTPSLLQEGERSRFQSQNREGGASHAQAVGICAHALLERWNFSKTEPPAAAEIATLCQRFVFLNNVNLTALRDELAMLMQTFVAADFYQSLRQATILGRETPFVIPWQERQLMEGVMDLIYRLDGKVWIADYKTDHVTKSEAPARAARYAQQAVIYRQAAAHCLGLSDVSFQFLFLRAGVSVAV